MYCMVKILARTLVRFVRGLVRGLCVLLCAQACALGLCSRAPAPCVPAFFALCVALCAALCARLVRSFVWTSLCRTRPGFVLDRFICQKQSTKRYKQLETTENNYNKLHKSTK